MTVQCGSDETSHRPRLGPLPTPPLGRVRAPSMEPAALPIKSMTLPFVLASCSLASPARRSTLPSSSRTPVAGEAPGDLLDPPFPLSRLCAHHALLSAFRRNGASVTAPGTGWSNVPAPSDTSRRRWSVTAPFDSSRLVGAASLRRCTHHSPHRARRVPGPKDPAGMIRERQRTTLASAGYRLHARRSQHPPQILALNALPAVGSNRVPRPTPPATVYQSIGKGPFVGRLAFGIGRTPTCPADTA